MVMIPAAHLSFSFRASAAHCKNCSCVHLPAAMCAKRFLYSRRYAENISSLFFLSAHTFGMLDANDDRIRSLLFKLCVETNMMMHVVAAHFKDDIGDLRALRGYAAEEVKRTYGRISFDNAVKIQSSPED